MTTVMRFAVVVAVVAVLAGCSSPEQQAANQIEGIVTEVTGDLEHVESFVVLDGDGMSHLLTPEDGLLFYGGPVSHLRDHIVSGERVVVTFEEGAYGAMIAVLIEHADGSTVHQSPDDDHGDHGDDDH